jgi:hypothetical protein
MSELIRAELAKELGFWPPTAKGWRWGWRRCGRYCYRKCLGHTTNPDHLVPSAGVCDECATPADTRPVCGGKTNERCLYTTRLRREGVAVTDDDWVWRRSGRYEYTPHRRNSTNPDHLVPSTPPTGPPLRIADRYAAGRPRR